MGIPLMQTLQKEYNLDYRPILIAMKKLIMYHIKPTKSFWVYLGTLLYRKDTSKKWEKVVNGWSLLHALVFI